MLDVDRDDAFDYENSSNAKFSVNDLKNILAIEIKQIKHEILANKWFIKTILGHQSQL